jgi:hypothetical protein
MASPKISSTLQRKIESLILSWKGKLTWDKLVDQIELELGLKATRQTLCTYSGIAASFKNQKSKLRDVPTEITRRITNSDVKLQEKIDRLKSENEILKRNNSQQLRMIERILSNARLLPNLDLTELLKERPEDH